MATGGLSFRTPRPPPSSGAVVAFLTFCRRLYKFEISRLTYLLRRRLELNQSQERRNDTIHFLHNSFGF